MTSLVTVKKEVEKLRQRVAPKPKEPLWVVFAWGPDDEPHGKYVHRKVEVYTGKREAVSEEDELRLLRKAYEDIAPEVRERAPYWATWENFLEYRRCKCPLHSSEAKQT